MHIRATRFVLFAVLMGLGAGVVLAQAPSAPPKPGPEQAKLAQFVGKWNSQADLKASPFGPAGKYSGVETCEWVSNRFGVMCRSQGTIPMGPISGVSLIAYDPQEKNYVYSEIDSFGEATISRGTLDGDTWTWTSEAKMGGKPMHQHFTMQVVSPDTITYKFEMAEADGPFNTIMEGKQTRIAKGTGTPRKK